MPKIVTNITGTIISPYIGGVKSCNFISGVIGKGVYMHLPSFTGFFVDLSKSIEVDIYKTPYKIGIITNNKDFIEINTSY